MNFSMFFDKIAKVSIKEDRIVISTSGGYFEIIKSCKIVQRSNKNKVVDEFIEERLGVRVEFLSEVVAKIYEYIVKNDLIIFKIW